MRKLSTLLFALMLYSGVNAQSGVGVSFSFFFPKGGEFSIPVSPFSYRGLAFPFNDYVGIQTGASLYRMGGQQITGLDFSSEKPMFGPNLTLFAPLELYLAFGNKTYTTTLKGGAYGVYSFFTKLNYGHIDRAIAKHENWLVANADLDYKLKPGWGYQGGIEFLYQVKRNLGITVEVNYLIGGSVIALNGTYTGGNSGSLQTLPLNVDKAKVEFTGLELSLGAVF